MASDTTASQPIEQQQFRYYHYDPSLAANAVFVGLFGVVAVAHAYLLIRRRAWFFIPFLIGCIFEVGGYIGRIVAANENPNFTLGVYIWQTLLILLGPALMAASIYMVLGRLIRLLDGHKYALIRSTWMTKLFVSGDVLSFLAQGAGGGILSGDDTSQATQDLGQGIILGGLGIQLFFFGLFIFTTILFHFRIAKNPTTRSFSVTTPWRQQLVALYVTSVLVMVRSIFRMAEFALGANSILMQHEAYLLGLDGALMFLVAGIFVWWHPYKALEGYKEMPKRPPGKGKRKDSEAGMSRNQSGDIEMLATDSESTRTTIPKPGGASVYDSDGNHGIGIAMPLMSNPGPGYHQIPDEHSGRQSPFGR